MKSFILTFALTAFTFVFTHHSLNAQTPMTKGLNVAQIGVGLGGWTTGYTTSETPVIVLTYEKGIKDNFGAGNLSIGGSIGYKSGRIGGFDFAASDWNYTYMAFVGRASWHPHFVRSEKLDLYTGMSLGYYLITSDYESVYGDFDFSTGGVELGIHIGGRYNFSEQFGAFAELGFGLGVLNVGVAYTF